MLEIHQEIPTLKILNIPILILDFPKEEFEFPKLSWKSKLVLAIFNVVINFFITKWYQGGNNTLPYYLILKTE